MDRIPIDFLIITIKDLELDALRAHLTDLRTQQYVDDANAYRYGTLPFSRDGETGEYSIVVFQLRSMGNPGATAGTMLALNRFAPQVRVIFGIAGGIAGEVAPGDVAISRELIYYEAGKLRREGMEHRAHPILANPVLAGHAAEFAGHEWHARISAARPGSTAPLSYPKAVVGLIASGEKILDSASELNKLKEHYPALVAVAMEGVGVAVPSEYIGNFASGDILEVRGISDLADSSKDDTWQPYAADAAAAFLVALLSGKPISSRASQNRTKPRILAICVQTMARVEPSEVANMLAPSDAQSVSNVNVDLTEFSSPSAILKDPVAVGRALAAPDGIYGRALGSAGTNRLVFYGQMHIPVAMLAGMIATDKVPVSLLDFRRTNVPPNWRWPTQSAADTKPLIRTDTYSKNSGDVVIAVSVSYEITAAQIASIIPDACAKIELRHPHPTIDNLSSEQDVRNSALQVRTALDDLTRLQPVPSLIHIFYAGPISLAFAIGQIVSPSIHPSIIVWNYRKGNYDWGYDMFAIIEGHDGLVLPAQIVSGDSLDH